MGSKAEDQLDRMENLLIEIAYEVGIIDEAGRWVPREARGEDEDDEDEEEEEKELAREEKEAIKQAKKDQKALKIEEKY